MHLSDRQCCAVPIQPKVTGTSKGRVTACEPSRLNLNAELIFWSKRGRTGLNGAGPACGLSLYHPSRSHMCVYTSLLCIKSVSTSSAPDQGMLPCMSRMLPRPRSESAEQTLLMTRQQCSCACASLAIGASSGKEKWTPLWDSNVFRSAIASLSEYSSSTSLGQKMTPSGGA